MSYKSISSSFGKNNETDRYKISKWEVVVSGVTDRVNIPCLMHDTRLCQIDVKMTNY